MTPPRTYADYLGDILENADKVHRFLQGVQKEELRTNEEKPYAVIRALEVVGEAAKQIPASFRRLYPDVPRRKMTGMRDVLIHHYFGVDLDVLWKTAHEDLRAAREAVARLLKDMEGEHHA